MDKPQISSTKKKKEAKSNSENILVGSLFSCMGHLTKMDLSVDY